ncbi:interferon a3-like [Kryptolebias marmoratus]|uniref:interferon a3-like n=1 Tax=Kryptolebias marmoratus TaxID=37003 RepID=UPI0007F89CC5|nr:interferon a3-like [Kryptolebias marmoratus]
MFWTTGTIFIFCSALSSALCCDWFTHYSDLRNSSMTLIEVMGGDFTNEQCPVAFPYNLYKKMEKRNMESQLLFIRNSLKQIYDLYRYGNLSSTAWDFVKTLDFLESVNRQIKELDSCDSSSACWEIIRKETKRHLDQLDLLGNRLGDAFRGRSATTRRH